MFMDDLFSVQDWVNFIKNVEDLNLIEVAQHIGTLKFRKEFLSQGYDTGDLLALYQSIALTFLERGFRIPDLMENNIVNYNDLAISHKIP